MKTIARSLSPIRGLWWLGRSMFESIRELHRLATQPPRAKGSQGRRLRDIEQLEDRTLPASINWINTNGGDWSNPANWNLGRVPTAADVVGINFTDSNGSRPAVAVTSADAAGDLNCSNPLVINGGSLAAAGPRSRHGLQWPLRPSGLGIGKARVAFAATVAQDEP